mmetsp:Transcript_10234/g.33805  ORF Transcript_10234/g.33805 Transcript_10234/m.33805 type:complete len:274 (+) Transcript_10234:718-1539(+)
MEPRVLRRPEDASLRRRRQGPRRPRGHGGGGIRQDSHGDDDKDDDDGEGASTADALGGPRVVVDGDRPRPEFAGGEYPVAVGGVEGRRRPAAGPHRRPRPGARRRGVVARAVKGERPDRRSDLLHGAAVRGRDALLHEPGPHGGGVVEARRDHRSVLPVDRHGRAVRGQGQKDHRRVARHSAPPLRLRRARSRRRVLRLGRSGVHVGLPHAAHRRAEPLRGSGPTRSRRRPSQGSGAPQDAARSQKLLLRPRRTKRETRGGGGVVGGVVVGDA